ncbi:MAG TPA: nidogen-like domain-containing protein [Verrucomicrobiae bacterium]|nr:nidogen-like domain-containing protein [Verrucomicrobiae bacterium]
MNRATPLILALCTTVALNIKAVVTVTGGTNFTFQADTTYYVTNTVTLYGVTTFEGGTVVKYAVGGALDVSNINWQATSYHPVVLTAKDDNSVGSTVPGSTGNPTTNYYANPALNFYGNPPSNWSMSNCRIAFASQAIIASCISFNFSFYDGQIVDCNSGIYVPGQGDVALRNILFAGVITMFNNPSYVNYDVQNCTFAGFTNYTPSFLINIGGSYQGPFGFYFRNCIFANMTQFVIGGSLIYDETLNGDHNGFWNQNGNVPTPFGDPNTQFVEPATPAVFQSAGAGDYYLSTQSPFHGVATTTGMDSALLNDLVGKTTVPPAAPPAPQPQGTTWNQLVTRDTCLQDLGYHYDPLDYLISGYSVSGAPTILTNGVSVGMYGGSGFAMQGGGGITVYGLPAQMSHIVWYPSVQEQPVLLNGSATPGGHAFTIGQNPGSPKIITLNYVDLPMQGEVQGFYDVGAAYFFPIVTLKNCWLREVSLSIVNYFPSASGPGSSIYLMNNLIERCSMGFYNGYGLMYYGQGQVYVFQNPLGLTLYNNLFWNSSLGLTYMQAQEQYGIDWLIHDNLFDGSSISLSGDGTYQSYVLDSNNAYNNTTVSGPFGGTGDVSLTQLQYAAGPLGSRYIGLATSATSSTALQDAGSRTSASAGLTNFTITPDQTPDSGTVDIGFHYLDYAIRPGFNQNYFPPNDDGSTPLVNLPLTMNFFGSNYSSLYVNNNGNVTFNNQLGIYTPEDLESLADSQQNDIIAPYWADVDTRACGRSWAVTYGTGSANGRNAFAINWVNVGYFAAEGDKLNSFQLVLIDRSDIAAGDFDMEFNYTKVQWETGDVSGGSDGLGGSSARAGYASWSSGATYEFDGSGINGAFLDSNRRTGLIYNSFENPVFGRYLFQFRDGDWPP